MADDTRDDEELPFRWHDLPTEMQDMVLDCLLGDQVCHASPDYEASLALRHYPLWNVLAVSRELKAQYEKRVAKMTTIIFADHENFNFTLLPLPPRLALVTRAEMRMFVICDSFCPTEKADCRAANDLSQTVHLIAKVQSQLPNLSSLVLLLGVWWISSASLEWPITAHHSRLNDMITGLPETPNIERIAVYRAKEQCLDASTIDDSQHMLVSWTSGTKQWTLGHAVNTSESAVQGMLASEVSAAAEPRIDDPAIPAVSDGSS